MSNITALRTHADICVPDDMDLVDLRMWAGTAMKLLLVAADEIAALKARDSAHVETIKVLAATLTGRQ